MIGRIWPHIWEFFLFSLFFNLHCVCYPGRFACDDVCFDCHVLGNGVLGGCRNVSLRSQVCVEVVTRLHVFVDSINYWFYDIMMPKFYLVSFDASNVWKFLAAHLYGLRNTQIILSTFRLIPRQGWVPLMTSLRCKLSLALISILNQNNVSRSGNRRHSSAVCILSCSVHVHFTPGST
mgnify:CR=1 FL=1